MKQRIIGILVIGMLLLTGAVSLSAATKEVTEKKELSTVSADPQGQQYNLSIFGGTSVKVLIADRTENHQIACNFVVWKYNNRDGYETQVLDQWANNTIGPGKALLITYRGYYFKGLNGRVEVTIYLDGNKVASSYGEYFLILTWGYILHH